MITPIPSSATVLHFGVGNFHRSHQAYAMQRLREFDPEAYCHWRVIGVSLMPSDLPIIAQLQKQQSTYHLKMGSPDRSEELYKIDTLACVLHTSQDAAEVVKHIANSSTKIISMTITEGGYNIDFDRMTFDFTNPAILGDYENREQPQTVFGLLAKGLDERMRNHGGDITLLSCDNILKNGRVLQLALESFLSRYDNELLAWTRQHVTYPNSMVDRITPATTDGDIAEVRQRYGVEDPCLVVAESFFQWVIEADSDSDLYPLQQVGVQFVRDVDPFEEMKLFILNGGHTLTGLLGDALGHHLISDAVLDSRIAAVYDRYVRQEVIPILHPIDGVSFSDYYSIVKARFANTLIKDTTARIIAGSSDKVPKFILPVIERQSARSDGKVNMAALIVAAWWYYLDSAYRRNAMADVQDRLKDTWMDIFRDREHSHTAFIQYAPVFGQVAALAPFRERYLHYISLLRSGAIAEAFTSG